MQEQQSVQVSNAEVVQGDKRPLSLPGYLH